MLRRRHGNPNVCNGIVRGFAFGWAGVAGRRAGRRRSHGSLTLKICVLGLVTAALVPACAWAQPVSGPYVSLGAGVNLQQNEIIDAAPAVGIFRDREDSFHPGFAGQASLGYGFGNGLRVEVEGDYLDNVVRGQTVAGVSSDIRAGGVEEKYGGFANVLYDFSFGLPISPYVGLGAGGQEVEHSGFNTSPIGFVFPPSAHTGSATVGDFAYQGIAGFAVPVPFVRGLAFTTEYRFIGLLDPMPAFSEQRYSAIGPVGGPINRKFSNNYNHVILLGLRYALFTPVPPLPASAVPPPVAAPAPEPARTYLVFFDWDRADLSARARQVVAAAAEASMHVQTTRIEVNGYTDLSGTAGYNQRLSVRRAESVEAELVRDGVARGEIGIHGYGESNPLVPTAQGVREPQNRRVEIILK